MQHLLIPTDFSIQSLQAVHAAVAASDRDKMKITLFHLLAMPTEISELVFRSMRSKHYEMITDDFKEACEILQNRYGTKLEAIHIRFGFGSTVAYLKNYLEGSGVDKVVVCKDVTLGRPSGRSVDMLPLLHKTGFPLSVIPRYTEHATGISAVNMLQGNEIKIPKEKNHVTQN